MGHAGRYGRRSIRLKGYDYTRDGTYFVTVCTQDRARVFGTVVDGEMHSNAYGHEIAHCWLWLAEQYPYVLLDEWIVMPDHTHAIIVITYDHRNGTHSDEIHPDGARSNEPCRGGGGGPNYNRLPGRIREWTRRWHESFGIRSAESQTVGTLGRGVQNRIHQTC